MAGMEGRKNEMGEMKLVDNRKERRRERKERKGRKDGRREGKKEGKNGRCIDGCNNRIGTKPRKRPMSRMKMYDERNDVRK